MDGTRRADQHAEGFHLLLQTTACSNKRKSKRRGEMVRAAVCGGSFDDQRSGGAGSSDSHLSPLELVPLSIAAEPHTYHGDHEPSRGVDALSPVPATPSSPTHPPLVAIPIILPRPLRALLSWPRSACESS